MNRSSQRKTLKGHTYDIWNTAFGRCLAPEPDCPETPIRAHSIQRHGPIRLLSTDGHVLRLGRRMDLEKGSAVRFERIGAREATVFTGLCAQHDARLFARIDREPLQVDDQEQLFLHAYRAVLREIHVCMEVATKTQEVYLKQCDVGLADPNVPSPLGLHAVERMMIAYELWEYKLQIDAALVERRFAAFIHDVIDLGVTGPCIAVSSLFTLDDVEVEDDVARVVLTVLPSESGRTHALFSYVERDAAPARGRLRDVLTASAQRQRYLLSRLILERTENMILSPKLYDLMDDTRKEVIRGFFEATLFHNDDQFEDQRLNLFDQTAA